MSIVQIPVHPVSRLRLLVASHPRSVLLWLGATTLLVASSVVSNEYIGRAALFVALAALLSGICDLTLWAVHSIAKIVDVYTRDVQRDVDGKPPDRGLIDLVRRREARHRTGSA